MPVADALLLKKHILQDALNGRQPTSVEFVLDVQIQNSTTDFFKADAPIMQTAKKELMCLRTTAKDSTGSIDVTILDSGCYQLFNVIASGLRSMWEEGVEGVDEQEDILTKLNNNMEENLKCFCTLAARVYCQEDKKYNVEVNVNNIELCSA